MINKMGFELLVDAMQVNKEEQRETKEQRETNL